MASKFGFDVMLKKMDALKRDLPPVIGAMGLSFFLQSFAKQGWTGDSFQPWEARKDTKNTRKLLIGKSGGTKNASHLHLRPQVANSLKKTTWQEILFDVSGVPYARIHNEGGVINKRASEKVTHFRFHESGNLRFAKSKKADFAMKNKVKAHSITMPKRQYIGYSSTLMKQIESRVNSEMIKILGRK